MVIARPTSAPRHVSPIFSDVCNISPIALLHSHCGSSFVLVLLPTLMLLARSDWRRADEGDVRESMMGSARRSRVVRRPCDVRHNVVHLEPRFSEAELISISRRRSMVRCPRYETEPAGGESQERERATMTLPSPFSPPPLPSLPHPHLFQPPTPFSSVERAKISLLLPARPCLAARFAARDQPPPSRHPARAFLASGHSLARPSESTIHPSAPPIQSIYPSGGRQRRAARA